MGGEEEFTKLTKKVWASLAKKKVLSGPAPSSSSQSPRLSQSREAGEVGSSQSMEDKCEERNFVRLVLGSLTTGSVEGHLGGAKMEAGS